MEGSGGDGGGSSPKSKSISESDIFISALDPLFNLSDSLANFKHRFLDLQNHLRSIDAALDSLSEINSLSELEQLCASTCSRGLRKYIVSHLTSESTLRQSVPRALRKFAPDPAKLVLDCVGGFYLQGIRAFSYASPVIPVRRAAILALEFFLLSKDVVSDSVVSPPLDSSSTVTKEAESTAIAWRKRMIAEGGISKASMLDARGLLLFICCFGIPSAFKADDVIQLIRASNWRDIVDALRRSQYLLPKIPGLLEEMARRRLGVEAVDLTFGFSMEDKITPQKILISSLKEAKEASTRNKEANSSPAVTKKAYEMHVTSLKSAVRCLKEHNLDPDKVLPGWQVSDMIAKLEKHVAEISGKSQGQGQSSTKRGSSRISTTTGTKRKKSKYEVAASSSHKLSGFKGPKESPHMGTHNSADNGSFLARSFDNRHLGHGPSSLSHLGAPGILAEASAYPATGTVGRVGIPSGVGISPAASHPWESLAEGTTPRIGITDPTYGQHVYREPAYLGQLEQRYPTLSVGVGGFHRPSLEGFPGLPTHPSNVPVLNDGGKPDPYRFADGI